MSIDNNNMDQPALKVFTELAQRTVYKSMLNLPLTDEEKGMAKFLVTLDLEAL